MKSSGMHIVDGDLHAFADNLLQADRRTAMLTALEVDAAEARRVSDWCAQNEAIRRLLGKVLHEPVPVALSLTAVPAPLPAAIAEPPSGIAARARTSDPLPQAQTQRRRGFHRAWRLRASASLVVAIALVLASGWTGAQLFATHGSDPRALDIGEASDATTAFALRAIETYRTFAPDTQYPVEIPAHQSTLLVQWLERRLGERVNIPKLGGTGYVLLGGRLVPWVAKRPAALIIYQNAQGQRLALMFAKVAVGSELPFRHEVFQGVGAITWMQSGNIVSVTGTADPQRLRSAATIAASELNDTPGPEAPSGWKPPS